MSRIKRIDPESADPSILRVCEAQTKQWGAPLNNHLIYARRPSIFRGVREMWGAIEKSGLIDGALQALVNRRIAAINGCLF